MAAHPSFTASFRSANEDSPLCLGYIDTGASAAATTGNCKFFEHDWLSVVSKKASEVSRASAQVFNFEYLDSDNGYRVSATMGYYAGRCLSTSSSGYVGVYGSRYDPWRVKNMSDEIIYPDSLTPMGIEIHLLNITFGNPLQTYNRTTLSSGSQYWWEYITDCGGNRQSVFMDIKEVF